MKEIITISREFGSAGRTIGKNVAEQLGYAYYDKEIIEKIAEESGLAKRFIERNGEYATGKNVFSYAFVGRTRDGLSVNDYLWQKQRETILELADKGKCVIVGRCADHILKERTDCLNVFIHADLEMRAKRIVEVYGESDVKPIERIKDKDKKRSVNYKYYTDKQWGMAGNYHLTLDSGVIGIGTCVEIICGLAKEI